MGRNTADTQSSGSVVSGSTQTRSLNIFNDRALAFVLKDATVYKKETGEMHDPKEHTTIALWEDLYNKVFLRGYSNNSQWYPINQTQKQMDICTFYFADTNPGKPGFRKLSLIFTEGKRVNNATSTKPGETLYDLEVQLGDYCKQWLNAQKPRGARDRINAHAVCGPYIRCFEVLLESNGSVLMKDYINQGQLGRVKGVTKEAYLDVRKIEDQMSLYTYFEGIKDKHPATPDRPNTSDDRPDTSDGSNGAAVSRPVSQSGSIGGASAPRPNSSGSGTGGGRPGTAGSGPQHGGRSGSPMSLDNNNSATGSPPRQSRVGTTATPAQRRSESPRDQPNMPIRHRSPQN